MGGGKKKRGIQGAWDGIDSARVIFRFFLKNARVLLRRVAQLAGATRAVCSFASSCETVDSSTFKEYTHTYTHTRTHAQDIAFLCMHVFWRVAELAHELGCAAEEKKNMNGRGGRH